MNKAFKIIWNTARGGYVVASEMQRAHGKTSRVKTAAAFALAGALALSATVTAKTITNDSISEETTTKLIYGDGELNIETAGDLRQLAEALKTGKLDAIRAALGVGSNAAGSTVTLVGAAGGKQYIDDNTLEILDAAKSFKSELKSIYEKLVQQTVSTDKRPVVTENGTQVIVGEKDQTPLVLGLTGADNVFNLGVSCSPSGIVSLVVPTLQSHAMEVNRKGDSEITAHSGNLLAVTGGSVALNVNGPVLQAGSGWLKVTVPLAAPSTTATVDGSTTISLQGTTTSAAVFTGGSAIALGGEATSNVTGTSHLSIGTKASPAGYEGMTLGAFGGGLSAATMGGTAASKVEKDTTVTITGGMAAGVFGGGAAMAAEFDGVWAGLKGPLGHYADYIDWKGDTLLVAGTAETISRNVSLTVGGQAQTAGLAGGGMAIDDTNSDAVNAVANTKDVVIAVTGGEVNRANMGVILNTAHGNTPNSGLPPSNGSYAHESADLAKTADAAILGAGVATGAGASVATETVKINLTGGTVNGSVFGGGAATIGGSSKVTQAVITVDGSAVSGSVYGGGLAGSTNNSGYTGSEAYSRAASSVETATVNLVSGSVTGDVYAGGYLYEGSNGAQSTVTEGTINLYSADVFQGQKLSGNGAQAAALNVGRFSKDFEKTVKLEGFTTITGSGGDLTNLEFSYGDKTESTIAGGAFFFTGVEPNAANRGKTLSIGSETAPVVAAFADIANAGKVMVTAGSTLGLGNGADLLSQTKRAAALTSNTPAVYASGNVNLTGSTILAGAGTAASAGLVVHNGTLVVDAAGKTNITNGTVTLEGDSILYFHNVGINLADGETTQTGSLKLADAPSTVKVDNILWKYVYGTDTYTLAQKSAEEVAQTTGIKTAGVIDFYNRLPSVSPLKDRIKDEFFLGEANLKGGMNLAAAAGVQAAALQGLGLATDTAQKRASLSQTFVDGVTSFAEVSGTRLDLGGNSSMNEINAELGGVIVGGEWTRSDMTFGGLANLGSGSVRGQSANAGVKNDVDYYGASLYAGKRFGQFNIVGQAGYLRTSNDLTDSSVGYAKADSVKTNVWTIGVRGEAAVQLYENSKLIPYVGLNYVRLNTDDYTVSNGTHVSSTHQSLWTVPVGRRQLPPGGLCSRSWMSPMFDPSATRMSKQRRLGVLLSDPSIWLFGQKMFCARAQALKPRRARSVWAFKAEPPAAATI